MIDWIQNWFSEQCDGNWEHENVIKIESLDNPGWSLEIDFNDTNIKFDTNVPWKLFNKDDNNWIGYKIENNIFYSSGDSKKLKLMLEIFKDLATDNIINETKIVL